MIAAFKDARNDASVGDSAADGAKALTDSTALPSGADNESNLGNGREDSGDAIAPDGDANNQNGADDDTATAAAQSSSDDVIGTS